MRFPYLYLFLLLLFAPIAQGSATAGLNEKCTAVPNSPEQWTTERSYSFKTQGNNYQLIWSRTIDGSGSICLSNGKKTFPVAFAQWQAEYLDRVTRIKGAIFSFEVHQGNGDNAPAKKYKLDLTNPDKPKVLLLKKWIIK